MSAFNAGWSAWGGGGSSAARKRPDGSGAGPGRQSRPSTSRATMFLIRFLIVVILAQALYIVKLKVSQQRRLMLEEERDNNGDNGNKNTRNDEAGSSDTISGIETGLRTPTITELSGTGSQTATISTQPDIITVTHEDADTGSVSTGDGKQPSELPRGDNAGVTVAGGGEREGSEEQGADELGQESEMESKDEEEVGSRREASERAAEAEAEAGGRRGAQAEPGEEETGARDGSGEADGTSRGQGEGEGQGQVNGALAQLRGGAFKREAEGAERGGVEGASGAGAGGEGEGGGESEGESEGEGKREGEGGGEGGWEPLRGPAEGMSCRAWLEEQDELTVGRDFERRPVRVASSEVRVFPSSMLFHKVSAPAEGMSCRAWLEERGWRNKMTGLLGGILRGDQCEWLPASAGLFSSPHPSQSAPPRSTFPPCEQVKRWDCDVPCEFVSAGDDVDASLTYAGPGKMVKRWECDVPCEFVSAGDDVDASLTGGQDGAALSPSSPSLRHPNHHPSLPPFSPPPFPPPQQVKRWECDVPCEFVSAGDDVDASLRYAVAGKMVLRSPLPPLIPQAPPPSPFPRIAPLPPVQVKRWDCDVPCEFVSAGDDVDASLTYAVPGKMVLRSMEARSYYPANDPAVSRGAYSVVMTVHYDSDVPVQYGSWEEYDIMRPPVPKTADAIAAAFISNCAANNFRLKAVEELQKFFPVHSYGRCLNNRPYEHDKLAVIQRYKFTLAFENSCEPDYITEKFWQSLVAGSVPVIVGPPNIADFVPDNSSYLYIQSEEDISRVARQMQAIAADDEAYNNMLEWKRSGPSDQFIANVDLSAVHSSCRLCVLLADRIRTQEIAASRKPRPCRCESVDSGKKQLTYHLYVRERGTYRYTSVFLTSTSLTLPGLRRAIRRTFKKKGYKPVWVGKRPAVLASEKRIKALRMRRSVQQQPQRSRGSAFGSLACVKAVGLPSLLLFAVVVVFNRHFQLIASPFSKRTASSHLFSASRRRRFSSKSRLKRAVERAAGRGFREPEWDSEGYVSASTLGQLAQEASINGTVVILVCSYGYADFLLNWAVYAGELGYGRNFLVFVEDRETFDLLRRRFPRQVRCDTLEVLRTGGEMARAGDRAGGGGGAQGSRAGGGD
ncbi:unnamed protein product [Closterium sp. Yama58-4]|nr:unnamed protein product [Closterium sp. Yama58-4]